MTSQMQVYRLMSGNFWPGVANPTVQTLFTRTIEIKRLVTGDSGLGLVFAWANS